MALKSKKKLKKKSKRFSPKWLFLLLLPVGLLFTLNALTQKQSVKQYAQAVPSPFCLGSCPTQEELYQSPCGESGGGGKSGGSWGGGQGGSWGKGGQSGSGGNSWWSGNKGSKGGSSGSWGGGQDNQSSEKQSFWQKVQGFFASWGKGGSQNQGGGSGNSWWSGNKGSWGGGNGSGGSGGSWGKGGSEGGSGGKGESGGSGSWGGSKTPCPSGQPGSGSGGGTAPTPGTGTSPAPTAGPTGGTGIAPTTGAPVSGDAASLAKQILANTKIKLLNSSKKDIQAAADGKTITNSDSCSKTISLDKNLLKVMLEIGKTHTYDVWNVVTEHGCDQFNHPKGKATDIGNADGKGSWQNSSFRTDAAKALSNVGGGGMGQQGCPGSNNPGGSNVTHFADGCNHQHIDVGSY